MSDITYPLGTVEYIKLPVTADVTLDTQTVAISIDKGTTWLPGTWVGSPGTTRIVRTSSPYTFDTALRPVNALVKITDSPEVPIIRSSNRISCA